MEFKDVFKELRLKKELKQGDIASILGIDRSTIGKWEQGINKPTIDVLLVVADYFDVTTDYLLGRPEKERILFQRNALDLKMLETFSHLNDLGKREAIKRIDELAEIPRYQNSSRLAIAAHTDKTPDSKELDLMQQDIDEL